MTSRLAAVRRGVQQMPLRCLVHGRGGIGKTTLAADAPSPIFLDLNNGSDLVDCARYPFKNDKDPNGEPTFTELLAAVRDIRLNGANEFKTLVIDTMGDMERIIWAHVIEDTNKRAKSKASNIEEVGGGYHKGYVIAMDYHRALAVELEQVRAVGMNVVLVAHSELVTRRNPAGLDWQQYGPAMHAKAAEFWIGWCDMVLFLAFEEGATATESRADKEKGKGQGWSTDRRLVYSREDATFRAKYRLPLESPVELPAVHPWRLIAEAHQALVNPLATWTREQLVAGCRAELARINNQATTDKFEQTLDDMTDDKLRQGLQSLRKR